MSSDRTARNWPEKTHLLVVEDNPLNQEMVAGMLEGLDLKAEVASDGKEAIEKLSSSAQEDPYTLILMDCQMPVMDGFEATQHIRDGTAGNCFKDIHIIAMTANDKDGDKENCLDAGMNDYLKKPVFPKNLKEMLEKWLVKDAFSRSSISSETPSNYGEASPVETQSIVWNKHLTMQRVEGDIKQLLRLIDLFADNMPERIDDLQNGIRKKNREKVALTAHTIKGIAANLDGLQVYEISSEMEVMAKQGQWEKQDQYLEDLRDAYRELHQEFSVFRSQHNVSDRKMASLNMEEIRTELRQITTKLSASDFIDPAHVEFLLTSTIDNPAHPLLKQLYGQLSFFELDEAQKTVNQILTELNVPFEREEGQACQTSPSY